MFKRLIASLVCLTFSFSNLQYVHAQDFSINKLPVPGTMVGISTPFAPLALKGLIVNPQKPLEFQFIVDTGKGPQDSITIKDQANQLVKYFLAGLTIPEGDLWVNLSPYEKNRMIPAALGQTDLGRDLLAQDYILKQLTASLIYPEKDLGKEFWSRVYAKAQKQFGTTNIPVNTFNKVWILPDQAQVYENVNASYVTKSTLKVMLDEDYTALQKHVTVRNGTDSIGSQIVREIVIPEITKEVNTGKNFAPLRQIYQALILAKWYKETIQNGLLDAVYTNKNKVAGVNLKDPAVKEQIYNRYLQAYKKGAFNYIKEDPTLDGQVVPRKYFSGGFTEMGMKIKRDGAMSAVKKVGVLFLLTVGLGVAGLGYNHVTNTTSYLIHQLKDTDWDAYNKAEDKLGKIGQPAVPELVEALKDSNSLVRIRAAEVLINIGDETTFPALVQELKMDPDDYVFDHLVEKLEKISDKTTIMPALIELLKTPNEKIRSGVRRILWVPRNTPSVAALTAYIKSADFMKPVEEFSFEHDWRMFALQAIGTSVKYNSGMFSSLIANLDIDDDEVSGIGIDDGTSRIKVETVKALGRIIGEDPRIIDILKVRATDLSYGASADAILALGMYKNLPEKGIDNDFFYKIYSIKDIDVRIELAAKQALIARKDIRIWENVIYPKLPQDQELFDVLYFPNEISGIEASEDGELLQLVGGNDNKLIKAVQDTFNTVDVINAIKKMNTWPDDKLIKYLPLIFEDPHHGGTWAGQSLSVIVSQLKMAEIAQRSDRVKALIDKGYFQLEDTVNADFQWSGWRSIPVKIPDVYFNGHKLNKNDKAMSQPKQTSNKNAAMLFAKTRLNWVLRNNSGNELVKKLDIFLPRIKSSKVAMEALNILGNSGKKEVIGSIRKFLLTKFDWQVHARAFEVLRQFGEEDAIRIFNNYQTHGKEQVIKDLQGHLEFEPEAALYWMEGDSFRLEHEPDGWKESSSGWSDAQGNDISDQHREFIPGKGWYIVRGIKLDQIPILAEKYRQEMVRLRDARFEAIKEVEKLPTLERDKVFMEALIDPDKEIHMLAMNQLDRLETNPEKKLIILINALYNCFHDLEEDLIKEIVRIERGTNREMAIEFIGKILNENGGHINNKVKLAQLLEAFGDSRGFLWIEDKAKRAKANLTVSEPDYNRLREALELMRDKRRTNSAMKSLTAENGGIDLNQINVLRHGKTVNVQFDPAQLNALTQGGFTGFSFKIESMTRISSPVQLLGINALKKQVMLAKA